MGEEKYTCDACDAEWEESFFCTKCSGSFTGTEIEEVPNVWYDGSGDEDVWEDVDQYAGDICGNCCNCGDYTSERSK